MLKRISWLTGVAAAAFVGVALANDPPEAVIETAANDVAERLENRRDELAQNTDELYQLINEVLGPLFDRRYAGYLVMGKGNWRDASDTQRNRFIDALYNFLLRSYATAVLEFDQDAIKIIDTKQEDDAKRAVVRTEMKLDDGTVVPVNYSMRKSDAGWRAYDVRIDGVSYVRNYRNQFSAEIREKGVEAVIARLETETASIAKSTE